MFTKKNSYTDPITDAKYVGDLKDGKKHGFGKLTYPDDDLIYVGTWKDNIFLKGKEIHILFSKTITREGRFEIIDDRPELFGCGQEEISRSGSDSVEKYVGEFKKGKRNGFGSVLYYLSEPILYDRGKEINQAVNGNTFYGSTYVGEWEDDEYNGYGIYTCLPNKIAKESASDRFRDDYHDDSGYFFEKSLLNFFQYSYSGQWLKGERNGKGTQIYQDGSTYNGEWMKDMKHGKGTFTSEWNDKLVGDWLKDVFLPKKEESDEV